MAHHDKSADARPGPDRREDDRVRALFRIVLDRAPLAVTVLGLDGRFQLVNPEAARLLGRSPGDLVGKSLAEALPPGLAESGARGLERVLATGEGHTEVVTVPAGKDALWYQTTTQPLRDVSGEVEAVVTLSLDVTDRQAREQSLDRESQDLAFLAKTAMALVELPLEADMNRFVAERLMEVVGDPGIVVVTRVDENTGQYFPAVVLGLGRLLDPLVKLMGMEPQNVRGDFSRDAKAVLGQGKLVSLEGGFPELVGDNLPRLVTAGAEKLFRFQDVFLQGFLRGDRIFGGVVILTRKGTAPLKMSLIEAFVGQAAVAMERRQAAEALREGKAHLEGLVESAQEAIVVTGAEGRILRVNGEFTRMFGYSREEALGQVIDDLVAPGDRLAEASRITANAWNGRRDHLETVRRRKDGSPIHVSLMTAPIVVEGVQRSVYAIYRDISERKRSEAEMARRRAHLEALVESAQEAIVLATSDGRIDSVNPEFTKIFGYEAAEVLGRVIDDVVAPPELMEEAARLTQAASEGSHAWLETERRRKDGTPIQVSLMTAPIVVDGEQVAVYGIYRDITERLRAEQEALRSERKFRAFFNAVDDAIFIHDIHGAILDVNEAACRHSGYGRDELLARTIQDLQPADCLDNMPETSRMLREQDKVLFETELLTKEGGRVPVEANVRCMELEGEVRLVGVLRNIADRKTAQDEQRRLEAQVQHSQKLESLGVLAGGIAHDFNNILMGILGNADLALAAIEDRSMVESSLASIRVAGRRAADLCRQMLAYSGKGRFVIEPLNLTSFVQEMARMLEISISKKASLTLDLDESLPLVEGDAGQVSQVVMNLITNASEALDGREGTIRLTTGAVELAPSDLRDVFPSGDLTPGSYVYLEVADTGEGMERDTVERIFDPFFTTKFTGRGLGLSAVLGIVKSHGGGIRIESAPGEGTTFRVYFPTAGAPEPSDAPEGEAPAPAWAGGGTILLVDDEDLVLEVGAQMLEVLGFEVIRAENGRAALDAFRRDPATVSAVVLDLTMPEMDGEETTRALKAIRPDVPVLMASGYSQQELEERFQDLGLAGFLEKPFLLEELQTKLQSVLEQPHEESP